MPNTGEMIMKIRLDQIWESWVNAISNRYEPQVLQRRDRKGNNYFKTYDPETRKSNTFSSEQEIRIWLDQRHSNL
jgi:hypothetical protein